MSRPDNDQGVVLTPDQVRSRRARNLAVGLTIGLLVVVFYAVTIAKLGMNVGLPGH